MQQLGSPHLLSCSRESNCVPGLAARALLAERSHQPHVLLYFLTDYIYGAQHVLTQCQVNSSFLLNIITVTFTLLSLHYDTLSYCASAWLSRNSPVEGHHAARDGHVHWDLSRHPPYQGHLLTCVRVEGRVIRVLSSPQLIFREAGGNDPLSRR